MRRTLPLLALVAVAGLIPGKLLADGAPSGPNIILIMADDLGYGDLGCYGRDDVETPRIDAMAQAGLRFTDYHANGAVCSPTRAALLTGRYQQRCGIEGVVTAAGHRDTGLPLEEVTIAETLQAVGYRTALFGKWHLGYEARFGPTKQGFDEFRGFVSGNVDYQSHIDQVGQRDWWRNDKLEPDDGYLTELITDYAVDFIHRHRARPFFLYLAHGAPHYPIQGPVDPAIRAPGKVPRQAGSRDRFMDGYRRMIAALDESVGRTQDAVRKAGIEAATLIIFVSDNGAASRYGGSCGELRGGKGSLYEGGHRVPGVVVMPGRIAKGEPQATVMGADWFATFAALAGAKVVSDRPLDGVDLSPLLFEGKSPAERNLFWATGPESAAVRSGDWKLIVDRGNVALYNLAEDLTETNNLAEQHPDIVRRLRKQLIGWEADVRRGVERRS